MSDTLKAAPALSFTTDEAHERVGRDGKKDAVHAQARDVLKRPNRLWLHTTGSDNRNVKVTYDGATLTVVADTQKIYATVKAPATLDETLDLVSERFVLRIAAADFLYSTPYDSFASGDGKGGWTRRVTVGGRECQEVAYSMKAVDFTLSMTSAAPVVPCEAQITYKEEPGQPITKLTFSGWNLKAEPADTQFAANVPQGYELVPVVERIPKSEIKADVARAMNLPKKEEKKTR